MLTQKFFLLELPKPIKGMVYDAMGQDIDVLRDVVVGRNYRMETFEPFKVEREYLLDQVNAYRVYRDIVQHCFW